tara:strand:- start:105 stop:434 length:330 start_codon:yes stop_codon:yes gene_type:complete
MKTLVLTGDDCATYMLVELAIKMGMDAERVASENDLVSEAIAEYDEEIDPDANEEGWRDAAINYIQYDLGIYVIEQIIPSDISADVIRDHVDNAVNKLKEAKKLLTEAL